MRSSIPVVFTLLFGFTFGCFGPSKRDKDRELFDEFKRKYGKSYPKHEEERRFCIFTMNKRHAEKLHSHDNGTAKFGMTKFLDMTTEEFNTLLTNSRYSAVPTDDWWGASDETDPLPASFDWRDMGAVTEVKYQGHCGSCYAFAVSANIESHWFLSKKQLHDLSPQQIVDCDQKDLGCKGGIPPDTYSEVMRMGGLMRLVDYPYEFDRYQCRLNVSKIVAKIDNYTRISQNETVMAQWLHKYGPMTATMDSQQLQFYQGGIFSPSAAICATFAWNHVVLIVGYGVENNIPYWIVKNSWGVDWGEQGYFRIYRGNGTCGINKFVFSSIINSTGK